MPRQTDTRARILTAARELFAAQTYRAASMRDIALKVGITKASLYHHFRSKSEILAALTTPALEALERAVATAADRPETVETRRDLLAECLDVMLSHREAMALLLHDASVYADEQEVMTRITDITEHAVRLLAGPNPTARERVRAAQAFAAITAPLGQLTDLPEDTLRAELLQGACALLEPAGQPRG